MKSISAQIIIFSLFFCLSGYSKNVNIVFNEDFEDTVKSIGLWGHPVSYSFTTGFSGNEVMFNNTKANSLLVSTSISLKNLYGTTIAISASIKGENLTGGGNLGMVVQLLATPDSGALRYYRIAVDTGTFDWTQVGEILKIDSDVVALNFEIGIYNATGKLWLDNLNIQVVAGAMPPSRSSSIAINKCHTDKMYRGMDINSDAITKSSLDVLSYEWKANNVRCQIGGANYVNGLLRTDFDSILTAELMVMDTLVKWNTANGLHMIVGMAGLSQGLFDSKAAQTRFIEAWKLIAAKYKIQMLFGHTTLPMNLFLIIYGL